MPASFSTSPKSNARRSAEPNIDAPRAHILIVEDEEDLRELLIFNLAREGFHVSAVPTGEQALSRVAVDAPDLLLLDLMLPGVGGLDVCRRIKSDPLLSKVCVVMLTAKGEESDIVAGLELGADDYITKPFSPRVLLARLRAMLRRTTSEHTQLTTDVIDRGGLLIDPQRHEVRLGDRVIELTAMEFRLLSLLAQRPGRVFTRQQIIEAIHGGETGVTDRSVDVQVVMLRRKLEHRADDIETVRGVGYRFRD